MYDVDSSLICLNISFDTYRINDEPAEVDSIFADSQNSQFPDFTPISV